MRYLIGTILLINNIYALDYDMDGVPDDIDVCNYTPFFDRVNSNGCSINRLILPDDKDSNSIDIILGYNISHNDESPDKEDIYSSSISLSYYNNGWIYGLKAGFLDEDGKDKADDTNINIKKIVQLNKNFRFTTGIFVDIPTNDFDGNKIDYGISEAINYYISDDVSIFTGGKYTIINDEDELENIHNQFNMYMGVGYFISKKVYANLYYENDRSKFYVKHRINSLNTSIFYQFNENWFTSIKYIQEIFDEDLHNNIDFQIGYTFW